MSIANLDKVRVSKDKLIFLKEGIKNLDNQAEIYVFGSRAYIHKKGGDIDLLILSVKRLENTDLLTIKKEFWREFGPQKLDLVNFTFHEDKPFKRITMNSAIRV